MPVNAVHPSYARYSPQWIKCRDVIEGEEAVKAAGPVYLPQLSEQADLDYDAYKSRAMFYAAAARTIKGLSGAITRKAPEIKLPEEHADLAKAIGLQGESLQQLLNVGVEEVLGIGRLGLYVDAPAVEGGQPYISLYYAENVVNWQTIEHEGRQILSLVVLKEIASEAGEDEFSLESVCQYRVLQLIAKTNEAGQVPSPGQDLYQYTVSVWRKQESEDDKKEEEWYKFSEVTPTVAGGKTIPFIPFTFINPSGTTPAIEKSPILDLVNVNLSHYRSSADLEHGRHFTALPTAWVAGFDPKTTKLKIGSQTAWVAADPQAQCGFLEFTGAGLGHLANALKDKEQLMAVLGARLLEEQKLGVEAADTVRLRHTGEQSILSKIADSVSEGFETALEWALLWLGVPEAEVTCQLNQDFSNVGIDPALLTSLMAAVQGGLISWDTWFYNIQRGELVPDGVSKEDEYQLIQEAPIPGPGGSMAGMETPPAAGGEGGTPPDNGGQPPVPGKIPVISHTRMPPGMGQ